MKILWSQLYWSKIDFREALPVIKCKYYILVKLKGFCTLGACFGVLIIRLPSEFLWYIPVTRSYTFTLCFMTCKYSRAGTVLQQLRCRWARGLLLFFFQFGTVAFSDHQDTLPLERPHPPWMVFRCHRGILRDQIIPRHLCHLRTAHFGDGGRVMLPGLLWANFALSQQRWSRTESRPRSWHCSPPRFPLVQGVDTAT